MNDSELRQLDVELDALDWEIAFLRRQQATETRERLDRLGFDVSRYASPTMPHQYEQRSRTHPTGAELELRAVQRSAPIDEEGEQRLVRTFETTEVALDGRNLEILCAPFYAPTRVADPPDFTPYEEEFLPGAFAEATERPKRVLLDFEHQSPISGVLGHAAALEERSDSLYGRFRVSEHPDGDKALALVRDGVLACASVMFKPLRSKRSHTGVVQRVKVHLDRVSLCRVGAYPQAKVVAVRTHAPRVDDELLRPLPMDPELVRRLERQGIRIPKRG